MAMAAMPPMPCNEFHLPWERPMLPQACREVPVPQLEDVLGEFHAPPAEEASGPLSLDMVEASIRDLSTSSSDDSCQDLGVWTSSSINQMSFSAMQRQLSEASEDLQSNEWTDPDQTLIILDWDDTLCPTSYIRSDPRLKFDELAPCFRESHGSYDESYLAEVREFLERQAATVRALLEHAVKLGRAVIVTLAQPSWVEDSIRYFMPSIDGILQELGIQVVYARSTKHPRRCRHAVAEGQDPGLILKREAMSRVVKEFYGTCGGRRGRSWKNVLSIGDSESERLALQDVIFRRVQRDHRGNWQECRCKVLKLLDEPSLEQLVGQLEPLSSWLAFIVQYDGDLDIDFGKELDDPEIAGLRSSA
uniref:Uncharacterized protein n=1 Tax=Alexandrium monilatum TaxID=311494 RepID=A0A7S4SH59_9DINO